MTLWLPLPPPLPSERNCSPCLEVGFLTLGTATPCHVNKARVFAWRFNTVVNKSAQECLPSADKGALWGRCAIPGGVPLRSLPPSSHPSSSPPHHMSLITTSSQKPLGLTAAICLLRRNVDEQITANQHGFAQKTHLLQQTDVYFTSLNYLLPYFTKLNIGTLLVLDNVY